MDGPCCRRRGPRKSLAKSEGLDCVFRGGPGLGGREGRRFSEQNSERRPEWGTGKKLHVSCSLLDPIGSRVFLRYH